MAFTGSTIPRRDVFFAVVHLLQIRRFDSWNILPRRRSGILFLFFSRRLFIFVVRMQPLIGGFYFVRLLIKEECRISSLCSPLICCWMQSKRTDYCKVRIEVFLFPGEIEHRTRETRKLWWPSILTKQLLRFVLRFRKRRGKK